MPSAPAKPCAQAGCAALTHDRLCPAHARAYERQRGSASARGYDRNWQRARLRYLAEHPLCAACKTANLETLATVVDHIKPHRGDDGLFWDQANWQPLCKRHHDAKTGTQDGGFGRNPLPA